MDNIMRIPKYWVYATILDFLLPMKGVGEFSPGSWLS